MVDLRPMSTETDVSKSEALALYEGNQAALAKDLGVTRQYISKLPDGPLPEWMALKLRFVLHPGEFMPVQTKQSQVV